MPPAAEPVVTTYLEMTTPPAGAPVAAPEGARVMQAHRPTVAFYRFLYDTVGGPWSWTDRRRFHDDALRAIIQHPAVSVHVLYADGTPAGFSELDARRWPEVQLAYFGLMPPFLGRGLGRFLLDWTVREAWRRGPARLWVHTCTLDHPGALPLYRRAGFVPFAVVT